MIGNGITDLNTISQSMNLPYNVVLNDILKLIELKILTNVSIDESGHKLKSGNDEFSFSFSFTKTQAQVRCPGCGAMYTLSEGESRECEFCGTKVVLNKKGLFDDFDINSFFKKILIKVFICLFSQRKQGFIP